MYLVAGKTHADKVKGACQRTKRMLRRCGIRQLQELWLFSLEKRKKNPAVIFLNL